MSWKSDASYSQREIPKPVHSTMLPAAWPGIAGIALVVLGIALRVRTYVFNYSFWMDESSLALNIIERDFTGLARPLGYFQTAPILFLWLEKLVVAVSQSTSEFAFRFVPLIAGVLSCVRFWLLCRSFRFGAIATLCATALFCLSDGLIYCSSQVKQYSTDVLVSVALYLTAARFLQKGSINRPYLYGCLGLLAIGLSHPSVFILAGIGSTMLVDSWKRRDRAQLLIHSSIIFVWLLGFVCNYLFSLRHITKIPGDDRILAAA